MPEYYLSRDLENGELMCIAPISTEIALAHNIEPEQAVGYYLYRRSAASHRSDVELLARVPTEDAVFELGKLLGLS